MLFNDTSDNNTLSDIRNDLEGDRGQDTLNVRSPGESAGNMPTSTSYTTDRKIFKLEVRVEKKTEVTEKKPQSGWMVAGVVPKTFQLLSKVSTN